MAQVEPAWPKLERSYLNHFYQEGDPYSKKCFEYVFFDQKGRLYLVPCGVDILLNAIGVFSFDGYAFQPLEIFNEQGAILKFPWIRMVDHHGQILGTDGQKHLFLVDPDNQQRRFAYLANTDFEKLKVLGLSTASDTTFVLGYTNDKKVHLFRLEEDLLHEDPAFYFPDSANIPEDYAILNTSEEVWISAHTLPFYRFDRRQQQFHTYDEKDFLGQSLITTNPSFTPSLRSIPKFVKHPKGNTYLFFSVVYNNSLFQYDPALDQFVTMKDQFPKGLRLIHKSYKLAVKLS